MPGQLPRVGIATLPLSMSLEGHLLRVNDVSSLPTGPHMLLYQIRVAGHQFIRSITLQCHLLGGSFPAGISIILTAGFWAPFSDSQSDSCLAARDAAMRDGRRIHWQELKKLVPAADKRCCWPDLLQRSFQNYPCSRLLIGASMHNSMFLLNLNTF